MSGTSHKKDQRQHVVVSFEEGDIDKSIDDEDRSFELVHDSCSEVAGHISLVLVQALHDLRRQADLSFLLSTRGLLIWIEILLSIVLIVGATTTWNENRDIGIATNSITLASCLFHLLIGLAGIINFQHPTALLVAMQMFKDGILLALQITVWITCSISGEELSTVQAIVGALLSITLLFSISFTSTEYIPKHFKKSKRQRWNLGRKLKTTVRYKRLRRHSY